MSNIKYDYIVHNIGSDNEPAYKAVLPAFGAVVYGDNLSELEHGIESVIKQEIRRYKKLGLKVPEENRLSSTNNKGKILLRIPPLLHKRLALEAKVKNKSINSYIKEKLSVV